MTIVSDNLVDGPSTDLLTDEAQFSTVLLDCIFENGFLLTVPVSVDPTSLVLLPLERESVAVVGRFVCPTFSCRFGFIFTLAMSSPLCQAADNSFVASVKKSTLCFWSAFTGRAFMAFSTTRVSGGFLGDREARRTLLHCGNKNV